VPTSERGGGSGPMVEAGAQPRHVAPIATLTGESERRLQALRRGLRRADRFTLYFVLASDAARAEVLRRLRAWSGKDSTPEMRFLPEGEACARATLELLGRADPALPLRGVVIPHAEALLDVDGGEAIAALNLARDVLGRIVEGSLVLLLPEDRAGELPRAAPDLFDVRSGVFEIEAIPAPEGTLHIVLPEVSTGAQRSPEELTAAKARLQLLTNAAEPPPAGALADAWLNLGWQFRWAAQWEEALHAAREARRLAEIVHYRSGVAEALLLEGGVHQLKSSLQDVGPAYGQALTIYRSMEDRLGEANTLSALGSLFMRTARLKDAEKAYLDALHVYESFEDGFGKAHTLKALGDLFVRTARLKDAEKAYSEALHLANTIDDRLGKANTLAALGDLFMLTDRVQGAERAYSEALHIYNAIEDPLGEANTLHDLGHLLVRTDRLQDAEKAYSSALNIFNNMGYPLGKANTLLATGNLFVRTARPKDAENAYSDALQIFKAIEDRLGEANTLRALGQILASNDRLEDAENAYSDALQIYTAIEHRLGEADTLQSFGLLALASDDPVAAFGWFLQALSIHQQVDPTLSVAADYSYLARAAMDAGHPLRAVVLGGRGLAMLSTLEDSFGQMLAAGNLAEALLERGERGAAEAALMLSWALAVSIGDPSADQRRARLVELNPSFNPVVPPPEPLLAEARAQIQDAVARCEARLAETGEDPYAPLETPSA